MDSTPRWMTWTGRILSAIPALLLCFSAALGLAHGKDVVDGMLKFGWQESSLLLLAVLQLGSVAFYVLPRTAVFGAILMTGYFGGAIATHVRVGDPGWPLALICGIVTWAGLYGRDARLRELLPLRRPQG